MEKKDRAITTISRNDNDIMKLRLSWGSTGILLLGMKIKDLPTSIPNQIWPYFLLCILLTLLAVLVPKGDDVLWINSRHNEWMDQWFALYTNLGDGLIFIPLVIFTLYLRFEYTMMCVSVCLMSGLIVSLLKRIVFDPSPRPAAILDNSLLHFVGGIDVHHAHSFPSGHTCTAFCAALVLTLISRNRVVAVLGLVAAGLVAYSRIYLLQHFLIDTAAGATIGCLSTLLIWVLFESFEKPTWMQKKLVWRFSNKVKQKESIDG